MALVGRSCTLDFGPVAIFWQSNITKGEIWVDKLQSMLYSRLSDLENRQQTLQNVRSAPRMYNQFQLSIVNTENEIRGIRSRKTVRSHATAGDHSFKRVFRLGGERQVGRR
jgi:hypothetical protein